MFCLTRVLWFPLCHFHLHEIFPYHLSICVSFALNWVSCRQHNVGSHFFTQSATLCILIGTFRPLTFKVIINWYVLIAILSPAFPLIFKFLPCPPPFFLWFELFLYYVPFGFCESVVCCWLVIILFFKYVNPLLYLLALSW